MERLFLLLGGLSTKAFSLLATGAFAVFGVTIGQMTTHQLYGSAIAGAIATAIGAVLLVIPRVMEQRRKSRESQAKLQIDAIALLMKTHDRDVASLERQIAADQLIVSIERDAKHKAISEWGSANNAYLIVATQLKEHKIEPAIVLESRTYNDIFGDADEEIKKIKRTRIAEIPAPKKEVELTRSPNDETRSSSVSKAAIAIGTVVTYALISQSVQCSAIKQKNNTLSDLQTEIEKAKQETMQHTGR